MTSDRLLRQVIAAAAAFVVLFLRPAAGVVHLNVKPFSFTFLDAPARFAPSLGADGGGRICGALHVADPITACSPLGPARAGAAAFALILRGNCSFEDKVRRAQQAGFQAAIVYDDQYQANLYSMVGDSKGIHIQAVFVSKMAGETLKKFAKGQDGECCISPTLEEAVGAVLITSLVSLAVIIAVVASFLVARNCWLLHRRQSPSSILRKEAVEGLPCLKYCRNYSNGKYEEETCPICLEDYKEAESLRVLPCKHEFHVDCVDPWLTKWNSFCPVCKLEVYPGK